MKEYWIISCNVKYHDIFSHVKETDEIVFKRRVSIQNDDVVYIYVSAPYQEIRFRCHVIDNSVDRETVAEKYKYVLRSDGANFMKLKIDYEIEHGKIPLDFIRTYGIQKILTPIRMPKKLREYIIEFEKERIVQN